MITVNIKHFPTFIDEEITSESSNNVPGVTAEANDRAQVL